VKERRQEYLLVDGYNVIFQSPELKGLLDDLEHARQRLVDTLVSFAVLSGQKITVVFDAHLVPGGTTHTERHGGVEVIYTAQGETADNVIERLAGKLSASGLVFVVTADYAEQRLILGRGAFRVPPVEFWARVRQLHDEAGHAYRKDLPADCYLENRLDERVRTALEAWRHKKPSG
jgi:hypothetical protein